MTEAEARTLLRDIIAGIAPEADFAGLADDEDMREALDLDSIDFTNLIIGLHARTGLDIPEADYHRLFTLAGAAGYLSDRAPGPSPA
ncbi:MAG: phosphopantetheine-binding protein [Acetobacteraceae bacterium SCN 69-10]|nr:acyl carrier protein [Rhodospirillales bacterium]ODU55530.1 MAG: phosphopantetheine-binding protein [Acetobacteraceae bacterium SCN 69-10]OJY66621.1 MAG: phosphopantetheine-binding protein [Rhodospirillales bacterium 70-18]